MKQPEEILTDLYNKYKNAYLMNTKTGYIKGFYRGKMLAYRKALYLIKCKNAFDLINKK